MQTQAIFHQFYSHAQFAGCLRPNASKYLGVSKGFEINLSHRIETACTFIGDLYISIAMSPRVVAISNIKRFKPPWRRWSIELLQMVPIKPLSRRFGMEPKPTVSNDVDTFKLLGPLIRSTPSRSSNSQLPRDPAFTPRSTWTDVRKGKWTTNSILRGMNKRSRIKHFCKGRCSC